MSGYLETYPLKALNRHVDELRHLFVAPEDLPSAPPTAGWYRHTGKQPVAFHQRLFKPELDKDEVQRGKVLDSFAELWPETVNLPKDFLLRGGGDMCVEIRGESGVAVDVAEGFQKPCIVLGLEDAFHPLLGGIAAMGVRRLEVVFASLVLVRGESAGRSQDAFGLFRVGRGHGISLNRAGREQAGGALECPCRVELAAPE